MSDIVTAIGVLIVAVWLLIGVGKLAATPSFSEDDFVDFICSTLTILLWPIFPRK